ncbi:MAG: glycosyltransferase family 4 protein [Microthrixaceae bacterium]|nr:glycosyltransferase family 4 protein [Microthrixaceae bacterium]
MSAPIRVAMTLTQDWHEVPGGTAVAANELARELGARDEVDLVGVVPPGTPTEGFEPPVPTVGLRLGPPLLYDSWTTVRRPRVAAAVRGVQIVHSTVPIAVPREQVPVVATVHDLLPITMPGSFTRRGVRMMRKGLERIRTEAAMVMVPSEMGLRTFCDHGFDRSRLRVVPLGVRVVEPPEPQVVAEVLARHRLEPPYVLFVGTEEPRKGLDVLARAMARLDRRGLTLALAGPAGWGDSGLDDLSSLIGQGDRVRRLGFVSAGDLAAIRAGASVCALPSRGEGFGLPALEAMATGVPLVTTRGTPMEEVADGAALLVPVGDVGALTQALEDVLGDPELAERMRSDGLRRSALYSWAHSADLVLDIYREVLAG